jgi:Mg2+/Co2+ transporter CorB
MIKKKSKYPLANHEEVHVIKRPKAKKKYKLIDFINKFVTEEGMVVAIYHDDDLNKIVYDLNSHAYRLIILYEDNGIHALVSRIKEKEIFDISGETYEKVLDNLLNVFVKEVFAPLETYCSINWCDLLNKYDKHFQY